MRLPKALAAATAAALITAFPAAMAQEAKPYFLSEQKEGEKLSDSYIGASVVARSQEGTEAVGKVTDLLLGGDDKIVGVVVDVGGFLGVGAKPVGLSWSSLQEEWAEGELLLRTSLTRQELEDAPAFKTSVEKQLEKDQQRMEKDSPLSAPEPAQ